MSIDEIIDELQSIEIDNSEDYETLDFLDSLCEQILEAQKGEQACQSLIQLLERHPDIDFGNPGTPVHTLERFIGHYETYLFESLRIRPTNLTLWMLNRIINSKHGSEKQELIQLMKQCGSNQQANQETRDMAMEFLDFQIEQLRAGNKG